MERYFKYGDEVAISLQKPHSGMLEMFIRSDYRQSLRKDKIYFSKEKINEIQNELKERWKNTKTKKLKSALFYFEELDWYDDLTDIYQTPVFSIRRGKQKPQVTYQSHGSIPKEWGAVLHFTIEMTSKITPLMEVVDKFFNANFNKEERKKLEKMFRGVLSGDVNFGHFYTPF